MQMLLFVFFTHLLLVFLISIFGVRRYNAVYELYAPLMKFTTIMNNSLGKNKLISITLGGYKKLP